MEQKITIKGKTQLVKEEMQPLDDLQFKFDALPYQ